MIRKIHNFIHSFITLQVNRKINPEETDSAYTAKKTANIVELCISLNTNIFKIYTNLSHVREWGGFLR